MYITSLCTFTYYCCFSMSSSMPSEAGFPSRRVSTPAMSSNFFPQSPDHHGSQVLHTPQRKGSVTGPPLSPLQSPPPTMTCTAGAPTSEKVLCRPYRHAQDAEIADSFNNVEVHNSHDRVSVPNIMNEGVPPPKPPRRASANPRMMEFTNDVVNGSRSNTASPELGGPIEEPPPIPIKKKNRKTLG